MNALKKTISALIALLMLLPLFGCSDSVSNGGGFQALFRLESSPESVPEPREPEKLTQLDLPYDPNDTGSGKLLDPFSASTSANRYVCGLIYDPLFRLDESFHPQPCVAAAAEYSSVELSEFETAHFCTVTLKEGLHFSDGSDVTAADVLYSVSLALGTGSTYRDSLSNIMSYTSAEDGRITFRLFTPDRMFESLLSFPIVKKDSPADNPLYIGSGRYRPVIVSGSLHLLRSEENGPDIGAIRLIDLVEVEDGDMLMYSLKIGLIDFAFFDLSDDASYNAASGTQEVQLNNMVFLGFNGASPLLSDVIIRQAAALAADREALLRAYSGMATAACSPQNPLYLEAEGLYRERQPDVAAALELLEQNGYDSRDEDGMLTARGGRLTLRLLVNSEDDRRSAAAGLIAEQFAQLGIEVLVEEHPFTEYTSMLALGDYDMYIGEIKLKADMDIAALLPGGRAAYYTAAGEEFMDSYRSWRAGGSLSAFNKAFDEELPFLPLLFRRGSVSFSRKLAYDVTATEQDIFYNILDWE